MHFTTSLKRNFQFRYVYNRGKSIANRHLVMYVVRNNSSCNHLGISVSKKVGNSVVRSRVTRLIRESYRLSEDTIKSGVDIVVIARGFAKDASYNEINASLNHLFRKHKLVLQKDNH